MTKFKVVRYWDTYPDRVVATCDTEEEAEKIRKKYLSNCKPYIEDSALSRNHADGVILHPMECSEERTKNSIYIH